MEVAARELDPGAARRRARRRASPRSSTARRPARTSGSSRSSCRSTRRNRVEWVRGEQQLLPRARARARAATSCTRSPRPRRRAAASRASTTIHDLNYLVVPDAHFGVRALGMRVLVPLAARRSHRVIADSRVDARRPRRAPAASPPAQDRRRAARPRPRRPAPRRRRRPSCASGSALGDRAACCSSLSAKRPHKNLRAAARRARARSRPSAGPSLVLPGYPTPHEAELRAHAARARRRGRRALPRLDAATPTSRACSRSRARVRLPVALRGLRAAGARGDGARRAGRLLGPRVAARGGRRRGAAVRPRATRARSRAAIERLLGDPAEADAPARRRAARGPRVHLGAHRRADARELRARAARRA